ncbi:MAG: sigma-70 family RNA polymerase sigma factor [Pseudomonadota bacterium]
MLTSVVPESSQWPKGLSSRVLMSSLLTKIAEERSDEAFQRLYNEYAPRVKTYMMQQGADPAMAEELAQETLLTVWRKASQYSADRGTAAAWIFTIARNLRIDRLRKDVRWQSLPDEQAEAIPSDAAGPDEAVSEDQRRVRVQAALAELPVDQRTVVTMAYIEGLSHSEIAEKLETPIGTIKSRMRLAYQKVRDALEDLQ